MFIDSVQITIASGRGGHGCISFRREKYVPNGGPDGGDGGRGGNVVFQATPNKNSLEGIRHKKNYSAKNGESGRGQNMSGKTGEDVTLLVPVGTFVRLGWDVDDTGRPCGRVLADLNSPHATRTLIKGGRGGRGNQHFATPARQAPKFCEDGKPGRSLKITLELKMIADVGIIGLPNAGKSTLLQALTNARPKIASYKFTTLSPNLGVYRMGFEREIVFADIPGLIEGASDGVGLGFEFLRHIERTRVLVHVVDGQALDGTAPADAVRQINAELFKYNPALIGRPQVIAMNKCDIGENPEHTRSLKALASENGWPLVSISAAAHIGLDDLMDTVWATLRDAPEVVHETEEAFDPFAHEPREEWINVAKIGDGQFSVEGPGIERLLGYTNMTSEKGLAFLQKFLREKGIIARLEELGVEDNDTVLLYDMEFEFWK